MAAIFQLLLQLGYPKLQLIVHGFQDYAAFTSGHLLNSAFSA